MQIGNVFRLCIIIKPFAALFLALGIVLALVNFFRSFVGSGVGFPLYHEIFYFVTQ